MADTKKQVPLRLSPKLYDAVAAWAEDDFRSVNGQIEYASGSAGRTENMFRMNWMSLRIWICNYPSPYTTAMSYLLFRNCLPSGNRSSHHMSAWQPPKQGTDQAVLIGASPLTSQFPVGN